MLLLAAEANPVYDQILVSIWHKFLRRWKHCELRENEISKASVLGLVREC